MSNFNLLQYCSLKERLCALQMMLGSHVEIICVMFLTVYDVSDCLWFFLLYFFFCLWLFLMFLCVKMGFLVLFWIYLSFLLKYTLLAVNWQHEPDVVLGMYKGESNCCGRLKVFPNNNSWCYTRVILLSLCIVLAHVSCFNIHVSTLVLCLIFTWKRRFHRSQHFSVWFWTCISIRSMIFTPVKNMKSVDYPLIHLGAKNSSTF